MTSFKNLTRFVERLGEGQQATVEKHRMIKTKELVAIKKYISGLNVDTAVLRELNMFQRLKACHTIAQCLDVDFKISGNGFIIQLLMPLYKQDLYDYMTHTDDVERVSRVEPWMNQMLAALSTLYYRGIVHCDVKPDNILLTQDDNLVLADFGLSMQLVCELNQRRELQKITNGSPLYLAPEILVQNTYYSTKGDLWSLGITFLQYLTLDIITDPPRWMLDHYAPSGDPMDQFMCIVFQILSLLTQPLIDSNEHYELVKNNQIIDVIDVPYILQETIPDAADMVPGRVVQNLVTMLRIDPLLRPEVVQMVDMEACDVMINMIDRGEIHDKSVMTPTNVYQLIDVVLNVGQQLKFEPATCYLAIDLLERYFYTYIITNVKYVWVIAASIMLSIRKINESKPTSMESLMMMFQHRFTMPLFIQVQVTVLNKLNYLLTTCDTDAFILVLQQTSDVYRSTLDPLLDAEDQQDMVHEWLYDKLRKTYNAMQRDGLYSGDTFVFDLIDYFNQA